VIYFTLGAKKEKLRYFPSPCDNVARFGFSPQKLERAYPGYPKNTKARPQAGSSINTMQSHLLEEASKVITNPQILINVISRRVKQLTAGHRPLVEPSVPSLGYCDTALTEVINGKLSYEYVAKPGAEAALPKIVSVAAFSPKRMAA
jgi:DNA-directed RNA polymerase subunit omega